MQEHAQQLTDLTERLRVADPAAVATQRRARKAQVLQIALALGKGEAALGEAGVQAMRALQNAAKEKRLVATEAGKVNSAAYFSDRGRLFQAERGRQDGVAVAALGKRAGTGLNVAESSTISLKRVAVGRESGLDLSPT